MAVPASDRMTETPLPSAPWRPCFANPLLNLAAYLGLLVGTAVYVVKADAHFVYPAVFVLASVWYGASCVWLTLDGRDGIDAHVASDAIITCGIASLILHVAVAGTRVDLELAHNGGFSAQIVRQVARVFAEGLVCAAAAPVIAMVLRFVEARASTSAASGAPPDMAQSLGDLSQRAAGMARSMGALASAIDASAEGYQGAASRVSISLEALATSVQAHSTTIVGQLAELEARLRALNDSMARSSDDFARIGTRMDEFSGKLRAGSVLLDGLRELIGSVDRFIRPDGDGKARARDP